jgi:hypothetical protein
VHFMRNLLAHVPQKDKSMVAALVRMVVAQTNRKAGGEQLAEAVRLMEPRWPKAATLLAEAENDVLACMAFPSEHWTRIYSTNPLERLNRETPALVDTVVLGQDTKYPVRARRVIGWGYELVDASDQYDLIVHRDVYGVMAHKAWDSLFQCHQHGIRITLIDPIRLDECRRSWGSNPALAPIPLSHRNRGRCDDLVLPGGFGDGRGAAIAVGCAWDDPDTPIRVPVDPEKCYLTVLSSGPNLTDITVTASVVGYNWVKAGMSSQMTPDLAASPFSPLLILQRRMNSFQASTSSVRKFRLAVAALGVSQLGQQLVRHPSALRQQLSQQARDLRPGDLGHLFSPSPVADSTGRLRPTRPW